MRLQTGILSHGRGSSPPPKKRWVVRRSKYASEGLQVYASAENNSVYQTELKVLSGVLLLMARHLVLPKPLPSAWRLLVHRYLQTWIFHRLPPFHHHRRPHHVGQILGVGCAGRTGGSDPLLSTVFSSLGPGALGFGASFACHGDTLCSIRGHCAPLIGLCG